MAVQFKDNRIKVKNALKKSSIAFLHEASGEIHDQVIRNMDTYPTGSWFTRQKEAWQIEVDDNKLEAVVGNPMQQALWTEFGTGEFAMHNDGRKGYWVYVKGSDGSVTTNGGKAYTLAEAKRAMAILQEKGLDAHITKGQKPRKPLRLALDKVKPKIEKIAKIVLEGMNNDS